MYRQPPLSLRIAQAVTLRFIDLCGFCFAFGAVCGVLGFAIGRLFT